MHPNHKLWFTGWVPLRAVFDRELVSDIPDLPMEATHWIGPDRTFFTSPLGKFLLNPTNTLSSDVRHAGHGKFTVVGGYSSEPTTSPFKDAHWAQEGDIEALRSYYKVGRRVVILV